MRGVNPADAGRVLKSLTDVWDVAAEKMLAAVAKRLARGITEEGWPEQKAREVLLVRAELRAIVERDLASGLESQAADALGEAYEMGANIEAVLGRQSGTNTRKVAELVTRFVTQMQGTFVPVIRAHEDLYQRAIGDSEALMQTGVIVRREAVAQAVDRLVSDGADRFEDKSKRKWHLDAYARMAGRTTAAQAAVQGQLDAMVARGKDLVVVSDSPRECKLCRPWEGKVLSITGRSIDKEFDGHLVEYTVAEAIATGFQHPNCTHRLDKFTPGLTVVPEPEENPEGYEQAQKLRAMERQMRQLKRELGAVEKLGDTSTARELRRRIKDYGRKIAAFAEETGQNRRHERERPVEGKPDTPAAAKAGASTPTPEPTPAPAPVAKSKAMPEPEQVPEPVVEPKPEREIKPAPVVEAKAKPIREIAPVAEPVAEPDPVVEPKPVREPEPVVAPEPEPIVLPKPEPVEADLGPVRVFPKVAGPKLGELLLADDPTPEQERTIAAAVKERFNGTYAGFQVETTEVLVEADKTVATGEIYAGGQKMGQWQRMFYRDDDGSGAPAAYHDYLQLDPQFQGQGFAKAFNSALYDWYRASGVKYVKTFANVDVGGYTWARQGWDFATVMTALVF